MKRRNVLKNLGLITGGILLFPSCNYSNEKATIALDKLNIDTAQKTILKEIVTTLIPEGKIPGGISLNAHNFVWIMINDCATKHEQDLFLEGLNRFNEKYSKFNTLDTAERLTVLEENNPIKATSGIAYFLLNTKHLAIQGYMNSEYILTKQMPYKLVPGAGSYETYKVINPNEKININA
jgi:hypothetical protein